MLITELAAVSIKPNTNEELTQLVLHYDEGYEKNVRSYVQGRNNAAECLSLFRHGSERVLVMNKQEIPRD